MHCVRMVTVCHQVADVVVLVVAEEGLEFVKALLALAERTHPVAVEIATRVVGIDTVFLGVSAKHHEVASGSADNNHSATEVVGGLCHFTGGEHRRIGAFSGSDLDVVLRGLRADHLVLAGISTCGVILSTVRYAGDLDYGMTVLFDACADHDPEVHRVLMRKVFPRQAEVVTVDEWIEALG